jgi:hypothetical protein
LKPAHLLSVALGTFLVASLAFSAALWVHREDVLSAALLGVGSAVGQIQFAGRVLAQNPSATGQRQAAYVIAQAAGQIMEAAPVVGQEGYSADGAIGLGIRLQAFVGQLQMGEESRQLVARQRKALIRLPRLVSPGYKTNPFDVMGRDLPHKLPTVERELTNAGIR